MKTRRFRSSFVGGEVLAMDPRAIEVEYPSEPDVSASVESMGICVVPISGPLEHHKSWCFDSYDAIVERLEEAFCDPDVHAVIMCIDSPGGDAAGTIETNRAIRRMKKRHGKPLYAYSNESMYSAAYAIGCAADEIWVPETGGVGSVGVIGALMDKTKANEMAGLRIQLLTTGARKADTHADRELTDDIIEHMQERVDYLGETFFKLVAKCRPMSVQDVTSLEAATYMGRDAVSVGLADAVGGWFQLLEHVTGQLTSPNDQSAPAAQETGNMKTKAQLVKARDAAKKALMLAKPGAAQESALATFTASVEELATFEAKESAKTKYVKKTEERQESDDEDEDEEASDSAEGDDEGDDEPDGDEDEEEDEEEEEDEKGKKASASLSRSAITKIVASAMKLTGKKNPSEVAGALEGMAPRVARSATTEARLAKIERERARDKVSAMLDKAKSEGRITPAQAKGLFSQGLKDSKWLKGYLSEQPKAVHTVDAGGYGHAQETGPQGLQEVTADQRRMMEQAAAANGMTVEAWTEKLEERRAKQAQKTSNGLAR